MNMYKIYLKQAWALMKENKLLTGVSLFGTALAICLVMVIVIVWQVRTANYAPEDYRDRMLYVTWATATGIENPDINNSSSLATRVVRECFYPSRLAEAVGLANRNYETLLSVPDHTVEAVLRYPLIFLLALLACLVLNLLCAPVSRRGGGRRHRSWRRSAAPTWGCPTPMAPVT